MLNEKIEYAQQLSRNGNWIEALEVFQAILTEAPDNLESLIGLGYVFYYLQRYAEGKGVLERGLCIASDNAELHFLLGSTYAMTKDWYKAMVNYHTAVVLEPTVAKYRLRLYAALAILAEPELALLQLEAAYQLDPTILGRHGKWKLWRVRIFTGLQPVVWLSGWVFLGTLTTVWGIYSLNQFLNWLGQYWVIASTTSGQTLLRAGIMSLPFVITGVHQLRKRRYRRALWVMILFILWAGLVWYLSHRVS